MNTKSAPRKFYFLTDFIRTHLCASLDSGIETCHQSKTWRYQGATVSVKICVLPCVCVLKQTIYRLIVVKKAFYQKVC